MKQGDKIEVEVYGALRHGVIESLGQSGQVVWVKLEGSNLPRWFHAQSLTVIN